MVTDKPFDAINAQATVTLSVGWTSTRTKLRQVPLSHDVADAFREVLNSTLTDLAARDAQPWAPDADLSPETYLTIIVSELGEKPELVSEHDGATLMDALLAAEDLPVLDRGTLPAGDLSFYAITVGDTAGQRAVFLRRTNPRRGLKRGRIYSIFSDALQTVEEPIFAFDEWMDLVCVGDTVAVLSQTVFAALFRGQDALQKQIPAWTTDLNAAVAIAESGRERLEKRALRDSRIRARLEAIVRRGHLTSVSGETLRGAMETSGLDPDHLIDADGNFVLEDEDIAPVLYFLNEDLFAGALTNTSFRADKKATR